MRAKLVWATHTRPDVCCAVSFSSQITESTFSQVAIRDGKRVIKHLKQTSDIKLQFQRLDQATLRILVYADASFDSATNHLSQLGIIKLLIPGKDCAGPEVDVQYDPREMHSHLWFW